MKAAETIGDAAGVAPPAMCQKALGELGRLALEAIARMEEGAAVAALSSLVALARINALVIESLQPALIDSPPHVTTPDDDFRSGVYL